VRSRTPLVPLKINTRPLLSFVPGAPTAMSGIVSPLISPAETRPALKEGSNSGGSGLFNVEQQASRGAVEYKHRALLRALCRILKIRSNQDIRNAIACEVAC